MFHIFLVMSKSHRFPLVLILHVQKWLLFAHVNLNSFSFFYSARSVPLPYTSCTMTLSDGGAIRTGDGLMDIHTILLLHKTHPYCLALSAGGMPK